VIYQVFSIINIRIYDILTQINHRYRSLSVPEIDNQDQFIKWFRYSSPYINAHRGKTFVILFDGDTVNDDDFPNLIHDIALLNSLGIKLVLVHGARPQINVRLAEKQLNTQIINHIRVTDESALECVKEAVGSVKMKIEAMLSMGVANSPMAGAKIRVVSGNYVMAKPFGIHNGIDYYFTGEVRRVDAQAINKQLNDDAIVLLSSTAYSPTGEIFSLTAEEVATRTAISLGADKFIHLTENINLLDSNNHNIKEMTLSQAKKYLVTNKHLANENTNISLNSCISVCGDGVKRAHIVNRHTPGALLLELFSRNGIGTLVTEDNYDLVRQAKIDDVGGIIEIIEPLERTGILVRRSRERLEIEIDHFTVMERDGMIIACTASTFYPEENLTELGCLAIHPDYRHENRGELLLSMIEKNSIKKNIDQIFVLTSQTSHWFIERGFQQASIADLPLEKQSLYNFQRNSKVFVKSISLK